MVGLPKQTYDDAVGCVDYCRSLLEKFQFDSRLSFFVAPLGPFLDPGSPAFEHPERFGYRKFCHSLEDHRRALTAPTWKHVLNYETDCLTRAQIVAATDDAAGRLAALKRSLGAISEEVYRETMARIQASQEVIAEVDEILALPEGAERDAALATAMEGQRKLQPQTTCTKEELQWPVAHRYGRLPRLLWLGARLLAHELYVLAVKRARLAAYHGVKQ